MLRRNELVDIKEFEMFCSSINQRSEKLLLLIHIRAGEGDVRCFNCSFFKADAGLECPFVHSCIYGGQCGGILS